jgi:4-aminobutyrate aminotransferase-like enzyme
VSCPQHRDPRPALGRAAGAQVADFTHTCFMITPYAEYVEVAEGLDILERAFASAV